MYVSASANAAAGVAHELQDLLAREEFQPFLAPLGAAGSAAAAQGSLYATFRSQAPLLKEVLGAPPPGRTKRLARLPLEQRFWVIAAAAEMAFQAADVLETLHRTEICHPLKPRADLIAAAYDVMTAPLRRRHYMWPFPCPLPGEDE
ncbi:hypothetical protein [Pannonibacter sp. SL95]|uniref:hypothetical protein n=1 Tax=Pannonibacter sp. SL95 TaxID=2995153 RepID=UPI002273195F|nr:hypothetical protein [Pannonibacter sp. SL95]MCY1704416.1 hypothetical protein [Pannonibacter sp. SL95]MCY1706456.1 hypothetical protein [Pannonibacter sp. SL95]MCY1707353.1 hypothetical protein [Pannonibacter sp. SL95]